MAIAPRRVVLEKEHYGDLRRLDEERPAWWYGYWQDLSLVEPVLQQVRGSVEVPSIAVGRVGIHVRRGDYVGNESALGAEYYRKALQTLLEKHDLGGSSSQIIVYSDDPEWCSRELGLGGVDYAPPASTLQDFTALVASEYLILSRSTFSWWAALLQDRDPANVIAPYPFTPNPARVLDWPEWGRLEVNA